MKAFIQTNSSGDFYNVNAFVANEGFESLGWETEKFTDAGSIRDKDPAAVVAGGIATVRGRLDMPGVPRPGEEMDYPAELIPYLGRRIWESTLEELFDHPDRWGVFVKPKEETKKFAGKIMSQFSDFIGLTDHERPTKIWCSELVSFRTEWRCFVRYGEILDIRRYKGAWDTAPDVVVIHQAIASFTKAPAAYALDFGIDEQGRMKLVEVNDGHSLGTYGISAVNYARFLSARWAELTGTRDYALF